MLKSFSQYGQDEFLDSFLNKINYVTKLKKLYLIKLYQ